MILWLKSAENNMYILLCGPGRAQLLSYAGD